MEWISVEDRLREKGQHVLCIDKDDRMFVSEYQPKWAPYDLGFYHGYCCGREPDNPTHWMLLPNKPESK